MRRNILSAYIRVSHSEEGAWGATPSHPTIFFNPPPPSKPMPPWGTPHLKMKPLPSEKQTTPIEM